MSYLRGEKSIFGPLNKGNIGMRLYPRTTEPLPTCCKSFKTTAELYPFYVILLIDIFINKDTTNGKKTL